MLVRCTDLSAALLFVFATSAFCATAEQPREDTPPKKDSPAESPKVDPTLFSDKLNKAANPPLPEPPRAEVVHVPPPPPRIPEIMVKALVQVEGKPTSALIEIDGKNQKFVSEGTELSVQSGEKQLLTLKIKKASPDGIEIELVQLKQTIHVK